MKRVMQLGIVWLALIALCGCSVVSRQEGKNIALSAEHEALCNSKNTLNKKLCRQTMGQLPKFENDVNAYFKEKFHIDGFKLTGINFPYDGFNHGGFHATFQLESDPYVMITDTFDYKGGKYMIREATNEEKDVTGQTLLATAILDSEFSKILPIEKIEKIMLELGFKTDKQRELYFGSSGNYFKEHNLVNRTSYFGGDNRILKEDRNTLITNYINKSGNTDYVEKYKETLVRKYKFAPMTYVSSEEEIKKQYNNYLNYIEKNTEFSELLTSRIIFYLVSDLSVEKFITTNEGEVKIDEL